MQYPATRIVSRPATILRFVDGAEQRFAEQGTICHRWVVSLSKLDEEELGNLQQFFERSQGRYESFTFVDPWTGTSYEDCSLADDEIKVCLEEIDRGSVELVIRQNRH